VPLFLRTNSNKPKALLTPWDGEKRTEKWFCAQATLDELWNSKRIIVTEKQVYKKIFLSDSGGRRPLNILDSELTGFSRNGTEEVRSLGIEMDFPKPTQLLRFLLSRVSQAPTEDIVLDFFSGSASTAHAVMQLNAEDGGKRRHIMVQIPEPCDDKGEAFKAGYKTIAEIGKERIRRAGKKILEEWQAKQAKEKPPQGDLLTPSSEIPVPHSPPDIGFRVLKIDSSNMADVYYQPDELTQDTLSLHVDNLKPGRSPEDLLFQVLLDWGVDFALPITEEKILKRRVFFVADNALAACFDTGLDEDFVKELAKRQPLRAVFRDSSYASDAVKINFEQIFKALSPHTELKTL
jgi:adenine-specific DNA-methyltransferase